MQMRVYFKLAVPSRGDTCQARLVLFGAPPASRAFQFVLIGLDVLVVSKQKTPGAALVVVLDDLELGRVPFVRIHLFVGM